MTRMVEIQDSVDFHSPNHAAKEQSLPTSQQEGDDAEHTIGFGWKVVLMGYGCGIVIGISVGYIVLTDKTIDCCLEIVRGEQCHRLRRRSKRNACGNVHSEKKLVVGLVFYGSLLCLFMNLSCKKSCYLCIVIIQILVVSCWIESSFVIIII